MRHIILSSIALLLITSNVAFSQENKRQDQKPITPSESDQTKTGVDRMVEEMLERGEPFISDTRCIGDCDDVSTTESDKGVTVGVVRLARPKYPPIAVAAHAEGSVAVKVVVDTDGKVIGVSVVSGHPLLQSASVEAARRSLFEPTLLEGKPVKVVGIIRYKFVIP